MFVCAALFIADLTSPVGAFIAVSVANCLPSPPAASPKSNVEIIEVLIETAKKTGLSPNRLFAIGFMVWGAIFFALGKML